MNFVVAQTFSLHASGIGRRLMATLRELYRLTPQERADRYVAHLPTAVLGR
jgi:hypothetical protein